MPVDITSEAHKLSGIVKRELARGECTSFTVWCTVASTIYQELLNKALDLS